MRTAEGNADRTRTGIHADEPKGKEPKRIAPTVERVEEWRSQDAMGSRWIHRDPRRRTTKGRTGASPPFMSSRDSQAREIHDQRSQGGRTRNPIEKDQTQKTKGGRRVCLTNEANRGPACTEALSEAEEARS